MYRARLHYLLRLKTLRMKHGFMFIHNMYEIFLFKDEITSSALSISDLFSALFNVLMLLFNVGQS